MGPTDVFMDNGDTRTWSSAPITTINSWLAGRPEPKGSVGFSNEVA